MLYRLLLLQYSSQYMICLAMQNPRGWTIDDLFYYPFLFFYHIHQSSLFHCSKKWQYQSTVVNFWRDVMFSTDVWCEKFRNIFNEIVREVDQENLAIPQRNFCRRKVHRAVGKLFREFYLMISSFRQDRTSFFAPAVAAVTFSHFKPLQEQILHALCGSLGLCCVVESRINIFVDACIKECYSSEHGVVRWWSEPSKTHWPVGDERKL